MFRNPQKKSANMVARKSGLDCRVVPEEETYLCCCCFGGGAMLLFLYTKARHGFVELLERNTHKKTRHLGEF